MSDLARRARELFLAALDLPEERRAAWLDQQAGDDPALGDEVASLLASHAASSDFLASPALAASGGHPASIGPYRILEVLGEGGMGLVYLAEQTEPIRRRVALKVIKLGMDTRRVQERFQRERQALALMGHPSIAKVLEVGTTPRGQAFFAMEYVDGRPITRFCDDEDLALEARLELMVRVCHAVQHAHQKGILHRDLKPSNVLVAVEDGRARPHVIDFGVARALETDGSSQPTGQDGGAVGTPDYMSPEQAGVGEADVDTRSDVYSLGVLLHELVVGRRPWQLAGQADSLDLVEARRVLGPDGPPPPPPTHHVDGARVPEELQWILRTALERDRARRYGTPNELAEDLGRYLRQEPVGVGPPSRTYQLRKLAQRHRGAFAAAGLVLVSLVVGLGAAATMWQKAEHARGETAAVLGDYRGLADAFLLTELVDRAAVLWPAWPDRLPAMAAWIDDAGGLLARIPLHEQRLAEGLEREAAGDAGGELAWLNDQRAVLLERLGRLARLDAQGPTVAAMQARRDLAVRLESATLTEAAAAWERARASVAADPRYGGLDLTPQLGLVPLEPDPDSGLWEFLVWGTGAAPVRGADGRWRVTADLGVVLVLLPGGTALVGAGPADDPEAFEIEGPRHERELAPFFLSKYELTMGQWRRLEDLATSAPDPAAEGDALDLALDLSSSSAVLPQSGMTWPEARGALARVGLELPTTTQWEYGARAGVGGPWVVPYDQLRHHANLYDRRAHAEHVRHAMGYEDWDDGHATEAPVGSFLPNAFGLHDTHGNLWEWCAGPVVYYPTGLPPADLEGELLGSIEELPERAVRGGSYLVKAFGTRLSLRVDQQVLRRNEVSGLRPARRLRP